VAITARFRVRLRAESHGRRHHLQPGADAPWAPPARGAAASCGTGSAHLSGRATRRGEGSDGVRQPVGRTPRSDRVVAERWRSPGAHADLSREPPNCLLSTSLDS